MAYERLWPLNKDFWRFLSKVCKFLCFFIMFSLAININNNNNNNKTMPEWVIDLQFGIKTLVDSYLYCMCLMKTWWSKRCAFHQKLFGAVICSARTSCYLIFSINTRTITKNNHSITKEIAQILKIEWDMEFSPFNIKKEQTD